jgi:hypothetical protein
LGAYFPENNYNKAIKTNPLGSVYCFLLSVNQLLVGTVFVTKTIKRIKQINDNVETD